MWTGRDSSHLRTSPQLEGQRLSQGGKGSEASSSCGETRGELAPSPCVRGLSDYLRPQVQPCGSSHRLLWTRPWGSFSTAGRSRQPAGTQGGRDSRSWPPPLTPLPSCLWYDVARDRQVFRLARDRSGRKAASGTRSGPASRPACSVEQASTSTPRRSRCWLRAERGRSAGAHQGRVCMSAPSLRLPSLGRGPPTASPWTSSHCPSPGATQLRMQSSDRSLGSSSTSPSN